MIGEATMAKVPIRTAEDKRWAAESDVNVLTEADVIRKHHLVSELQKWQLSAW